MPALPYMQLFVAEYLADTAHLTAAQHGAYMLLLMNYWQRGKPLRNVDARLANVARMTADEWDKSRAVLSEFFEVTPDEWRHRRVDRDLDNVTEKCAKASTAGRASAAKRSNVRSTFVQQTFNHKEEKRILSTPLTPLEGGRAMRLHEVRKLSQATIGMWTSQDGPTAQQIESERSDAEAREYWREMKVRDPVRWDKTAPGIARVG